MNRMLNASVISILLAAGAAADQPALRGPAVRERDVPGARGDFGGAEGTRRRLAERIPPHVYRDALREVVGPDAPEPTRATPEQREKIKALMDAHERTVREYSRQHRDELSRLRGDGGGPPDGTGRGPGRGRPEGGPGGPDRRPRPEGAEGPGPEHRPVPPAADDRETARGRARELLEDAPRPEDLITRVWEELTPAQRDAVDAKLREFRERQAREREESYVRRMAGDRGGPRSDGARPGPRGPERAGPDVPGERQGLSPARRERLLRLLSRLTPEQQDRLLDRLESHGEERRPSGDPRPEPHRRPPTRDGLNAPDPDSRSEMSPS